MNFRPFPEFWEKVCHCGSLSFSLHDIVTSSTHTKFQQSGMNRTFQYNNDNNIIEDSSNYLPLYIIFLGSLWIVGNWPHPKGGLKRVLSHLILFSSFFISVNFLRYISYTSDAVRNFCLPSILMILFDVFFFFNIKYAASSTPSDWQIRNVMS